MPITTPMSSATSEAVTLTSYPKTVGRRRNIREQAALYGGREVSDDPQPHRGAGHLATLGLRPVPDRSKSTTVAAPGKAPSASGRRPSSAAITAFFKNMAEML